MNRYILRLFPIVFLSGVCAFAQGGGRGRGAAGATGAPPPVQLIGGRFKAYPQDAIDRGTTSYNKTCGYCHGDRAKGGNAGPDLVRSDVSLHDEDGVGLGEYLKGDKHQKAVKLDLSQSDTYDVAAYLHSRIIVAAVTRGTADPDAVLKAGNADAGKAYFNGAGGCTKCHTVDGNLKGVGSKYDAATLQDRIVMPQRGRGSSATAVTAVVTQADGKTFKGAPVRVTDFDIILRLDDGSQMSWARNNGVPRVDLTDPLAGHIEIMKRLKDQDMHNLAAYLATVK